MKKLSLLLLGLVLLSLSSYAEQNIEPFYSDDNYDRFLIDTLPKCYGFTRIHVFAKDGTLDSNITFDGCGLESGDKSKWICGCEYLEDNKIIAKVHDKKTETYDIKTEFYINEAMDYDGRRNKEYASITLTPVNEFKVEGLEYVGLIVLGLLGLGILGVGAFFGFSKLKSKIKKEDDEDSILVSDTTIEEEYKKAVDNYSEEW